ncbi:MAG: S26 family signal peptidase [Methylococcales bacterium]
MDLTSPQEHARRVKFRKIMGKWLVSISLVFVFLWGISPWVKFSYNATESLDGSLFIILKDVEIHKGDKVAFWPPRNRFYKYGFFVKYAAGIEGDIITVLDKSFFLGEEFLGVAETITRTGEPLVASKGGTIPANNYFVWTPHKRSFDSRYVDIGLIHEDNIIGRAYRIF